MDGFRSVRDVLRVPAVPVREVTMKFAELNKINVKDKIEKKNGLNYLSWAWAVEQLLLNDPSATWEYKPYQMWGDTVMVFCSVKAFGVERTAQLPVMDYKNKAIANPDSFAVNTAMQRCLAKAIALHGIGLYIYAGEDLPSSESSESPEFTEKLMLIAEATKETLKEVYEAIYSEYKDYPSLQKEIIKVKDQRKTALGIK